MVPCIIHQRVERLDWCDKWYVKGNNVTNLDMQIQGNIADSSLWSNQMCALKVWHFFLLKWYHNNDGNGIGNHTDVDDDDVDD